MEIGEKSKLYRQNTAIHFVHSILLAEGLGGAFRVFQTLADCVSIHVAAITSSLPVKGAALGNASAACSMVD